MFRICRKACLVALPAASIKFEMLCFNGRVIGKRELDATREIALALIDLVLWVGQAIHLYHVAVEAVTEDRVARCVLYRRDRGGMRTGEKLGATVLAAVGVDIGSTQIDLFSELRSDSELPVLCNS